MFLKSFMANQQPQQQIQIKATDEDLKGKYANMMQVTHTQEEFILDFFLVVPPQGALTSRVVMSPRHLKRMVQALQENVQKYEDKFGKIEKSEALEAKVGF